MSWFGSWSKRASQTRADRRGSSTTSRDRSGPLLDGAMLAALRGMSLRDVRASGSIQGVHRGGMPGAGEDFFQHRPYVRGEDIRGIDFRASARASQLLVKERHRPLRRGLVLLLDASASMGFLRAGESRNGSSGSDSKERIARQIGAALACLALRDGDPVSLFLFNGSELSPAGRCVPNGQAVASAERLLATPTSKMVASATVYPSTNDTADVLKAFATFDSRAAAGAHLVLISDLYGDEGALAQALRTLRPAAVAATLFHVLSPADCELPEAAVVRDIESGRERSIDSAERAAVASRVLAWQERLRAEATRSGTAFVAIDTDEPLAESLRRWLSTSTIARR